LTRQGGTAALNRCGAAGAGCRPHRAVAPLVGGCPGCLGCREGTRFHRRFGTGRRPQTGSGRHARAADES